MGHRFGVRRSRDPAAGDCEPTSVVPDDGKMKRRLLLQLAAGFGAMGWLSCCGASSLEGQHRPWAGGTAVADPDFEVIFRPESPVESFELRRGTDRRIYAVSRFTKRPSFDYVKDYEKLLRTRGVLLWPHNTSPREIPWHRLGMNFLVIQKMWHEPYTVRYREFEDTDWRWINRDVWTNYPYPIEVHGRELVVRLGEEALLPWRETVLVPDKDVVSVKEFPFPRYPGAVLQEVHGGEDAWLRQPLTDSSMASVYRRYVVRGVPIQAVFDHYETATAETGTPVGGSDPNPSERQWYNPKAVGGIIAVTILSNPGAVFIGSKWCADSLKTEASLFMSDFPDDVTVFDVRLSFADAHVAMSYWPQSWRDRRETLLRAQR